MSLQLLTGDVFVTFDKGKSVPVKSYIQSMKELKHIINKSYQLLLIQQYCLELYTSDLIN